MDHEVAKVISIPASAASAAHVIYYAEKRVAQQKLPSRVLLFKGIEWRYIERGVISIEKWNLVAELEVTVALATFGSRECLQLAYELWCFCVKARLFHWPIWPLEFFLGLLN
jgi:hypothetical protein